MILYVCILTSPIFLEFTLRVTMKGWDGALRRWPVGHGGSPNCAGNWLSSGLLAFIWHFENYQILGQKGAQRFVIFLETGSRAPKVGLYIPLQSNSVSPMNQSTGEINQTMKLENGANPGLLSVTQHMGSEKSSMCYIPHCILLPTLWYPESFLDSFLLTQQDPHHSRGGRTVMNRIVYSK